MTESASTKGMSAAESFTPERLRDMLQPLWKILTFSLADDSIAYKKDVCVSIDRAGLSVVFGSIFMSKSRIGGFKSYPLEGRYPQPEDLASAVSLALNEMKVAAKDITLSIPKEWAVIRDAEFPSVVKQNLPSVISYELDRLTPFSSEGAYYDFRVLKEEEGRLALLVVAARGDVINPYIAALREKGIKVKRLTINLSGIGMLCRFIDEGDDIVFCDISAECYEGAVFRKGRITGAFTGNFPASDDRSRADAIMKELDPLVERLRKQGVAPHVVIYRRDKGQALDELLKFRINLPFKMLDAAGVRLDIQGSRRDVPYTATGGVLESLVPGAERLNMLTRGIQEKAKAPVKLTIVLLIALLGIWMLYMIVPLRIEGERLKDIDKQVAAMKDDVRKVEALKKEADALDGQISTINNFKGNNPMVLDIIKELTAILPKTAWLSRMRVTGSTVEIEGYAASATELLPKLEASKKFKKAEFASSTFRDARQNAERFSIKMEIESAQKDGGEDAKKAAQMATVSPGAPVHEAAGSNLSKAGGSAAPAGPANKNGKK